MKKFFYYIILPIILYVFLAVFLYDKVYRDFNQSINGSLIVIQGLGILIGGMWAFRKFGWEKKCENIISLKAALMNYSLQHNLSAAQYNIDKDVLGYKSRLLTPYNNLLHSIHLSYYVSEKLRKKIFNTIWLTVGNDTGKDFEKLKDNWDKYEKHIKEIYDEFDKITSL